MRRGLVRGATGARRVDEALVREAVRRVRQLSIDGALETAREIGEYLLATFYGGDLEVYEAIGGDHVSMQAVVRDPELRLPAHNLWNALDYLQQLRELPSDVAGVLTYSHHKALFRVPDPRMKVRLAREAVRRRLKVKVLERRVRELLGDDPRGRGRLPRPPLLRLPDRLGKLVGAIGADDLSDRSLKALSPGRRAWVARKLDALAERLSEIAERLRTFDG